MHLRAKNTQETLIKSGGIPYTTLHATQFFEFVKRIADDATEGTTVRVAGPQVFRFDELIRRGLGNDSRKIVVDPHARCFGSELDERSLIPAGNARLGEIRFEDWLGQPALAK